MKTKNNFRLYHPLHYNQVVVYCFKAGANEENLIFEKPGRQKFNPKVYIQAL